MKLLIILQIIFALLLSPPSVYVKGRGYAGYIFDKDQLVTISIENQQSRFTPTPEEVETAEKLLKAQLPELNIYKTNQTSNCPNIEKKIKKYTRQYFGLTNNNREKVIWINLLLLKNNDLNASENIIRVCDGGSYFWNIKVNITTGEVFDLDVNG